MPTGATLSRRTARGIDSNGVPMARLESMHPELKRLTEDFLREMGFSSREAYLAAGLPIPEGTVVSSIQSSGGDYTSAAAWANAAAREDATEDQTGQIDEAFDAGACTIDASNTNSVTHTLTAAAAYRFYAQAGWPNCAAVEGDGARCVGQITVGTTNVVVEWLEITGGAYGVDSSVGGTVRYNLIRDVTHTCRTTSGTMTVHTVLSYGLSNGPTSASTGTVNCYHVTLFSSSVRGFRQAGTSNCYNCVALNCTSDYSGTIGGDYNLSSDTTAPGTTNWQSKIWQNVIANGNAGEEDLHLVRERIWSSAVTSGSEFASGSFSAAGWLTLVTVGGLTFSTDNPLYGTHSAKLVLSNAGTYQLLYRDYGASAQSTYPTHYENLNYYFDSLTMSNGDVFILACAYDSAAQWRLEVRKDSGNHQLGLFYGGNASTEGGGTQLGSWQTFTLQQWINIEIKFTYNASGAVQWWIDGSSIASVATDTSSLGFRYIAPFRCNSTSTASVTGTIYFDLYQFGTSQHGVPPYDSSGAAAATGFDASGDYLGGDYSGTIGTTDIDGETRGANDVGADGIASVASPITLTATTPAITVSAPAATLSAPASLAAGTPTIASSAPAATLNNPAALSAGTPEIVTSAPAAALLAPTTLAATTPEIVTSAPAALLILPITLVATTPEIVASAPPAVLGLPISISAGTPAIAASAPAATLSAPAVLSAGSPVITLSAPAGTLSNPAALAATTPSIFTSSPAGTLILPTVLVATTPAIVVTAPAGTLDVVQPEIVIRITLTASDVAPRLVASDSMIRLRATTRSI